EGQREALQRQFLDAQTKLAGRAVQIARESPSDPAALEALVFALHRTGGGYGGEGGKVRDEAFALIRKTFLKSPGLSNLLYFIAYQHTDSAEELLEAVIQANPHRAIQGRAAVRLAETLGEKSEMARLLRLMPELLKHPQARDRGETLALLVKADP